MVLFFCAHRRTHIYSSMDLEKSNSFFKIFVYFKFPMARIFWKRGRNDALSRGNKPADSVLRRESPHPGPQLCGQHPSASGPFGAAGRDGDAAQASGDGAAYGGGHGPAALWHGDAGFAPAPGLHPQGQADSVSGGPGGEGERRPGDPAGACAAGSCQGGGDGGGEAA